MKKIFAVIAAVLFGLPAEALAQEVIDSPIRAVAFRELARLVDNDSLFVKSGTRQLRR
jgi:hypothetical protein